MHIRKTNYPLIMIRIILFLLLFTGVLTGQQKVILDADTANEVDDLYAIVRALEHEEWNIVALNAVQWEASHWSEPKSMEASHRLNQTLRSYMKKDVPTWRGGADRLYDWGDIAQHSAAAYKIIEHAKSMPAGDKLTVIALGALTNIASALLIEPTIQDQIKLYWLGSTYDFEVDKVGRRDFNVMMDQQAWEEIYASEVEMYVLPVSVANQFTFSLEEVEENLKERHALCDLLLDRWYDHRDGGKYQRVLWDLALIEAIIHPEMASWKEVSPINLMKDRSMTYIEDIDVPAMKSEFYKSLDKTIKRISK